MITIGNILMMYNKLVGLQGYSFPIEKRNRLTNELNMESAEF